MFKEGRQEEGLFLLYQTISLFSNVFLKGFYSDLRLLNLSQVNIVRRTPTNSAAVEDLSFQGS